MVKLIREVAPRDKARPKKMQKQKEKVCKGQKHEQKEKAEAR